MKKEDEIKLLRKNIRNLKKEIDEMEDEMYFLEGNVESSKDHLEEFKIQLKELTKKK